MCSGEERSVRVRTGMAGTAWLVKFRIGRDSRGMAGVVLLGLARYGPERPGADLCGEVRKGRSGREWLRSVGP